MFDFYQKNLGCSSLSCLEWIRSFFLTLGKKELFVKTIEENSFITYSYDMKTKQRIPKEKVNKKIVEKLIKGDEVKTRMMNCARSFASYIKHKERGKLNRRAIASANMILRMFLYLIEEFHLELGRYIEGSTISIGGEEKKAKIINNLGKAVLPNQDGVIETQGTEDATKWSECLSPAAFAMMHKTFFDPLIRKELGLPLPSEYAVLFMEMSLSAHFIMAIKRIALGPGPLANNGVFYNRLNWLTTPIERFNSP